MMVDSYKPYISGVTNYVEINKRHLELTGHDVFVFTFGDSETSDGEPRVIRSKGLPLADSGFYLSMRYSHSAKQLLQTMDIIHVHHPFLSGRLALRYGRPLQIPVVYTNHTRYDLYAQAYLPLMPDEVSIGLLQTYMPSFCKAMDLVITPSAGMERILRQLNVDSPIAVVPNGVDLKSFHSAVPHSRASFGYKADDILLVYAGRIALEKNLPFLLQSFKGIAQAIPNVHLLIIGSGLHQFDEEIRSLAANLPVKDRIRFTGRLTYDKLPAYLAMCDIFVTASMTEVHPLSVIEAMGAGLPIMGMESVGVGDIVTDGVIGFLGDEDLPSFTAKLTRLCLDQGLRRQMSHAARNASATYAIENTTRVMLKHYETMVAEAQPRKTSWRTRIRTFVEKVKL